MAESKDGKVARKADVLAAECPSRAVLDHVSSRWGVLVLLALRKGTHRFGELRRVVGGVSEKMLTQTLAALERDGFVSRTPHAVIPPRVDYELTESGVGLALHVEGLVRFIEGNMDLVGAAHEAYDRRRPDALVRRGRTKPT